METSLCTLTNELIVGSGYTVEGQKTGEEKYGGLQIEIIPSYQEKLRVWLRQPLEGNEKGVYTVPFDWSRCLDELKTPAELALHKGDKIRSYPAKPTYSVPYTILDLTGDPQNSEIHVTVYECFLNTV